MTGTKPPQYSRFEQHAPGRLPQGDIATGVGGSRISDKRDEPMGGGGLEQVKAPLWFREMLRKRKPVAEIMKAVHDRVLSGKVDLHTAKTLVNSAGRITGGREAVKSLFTQKMVFEIMKRGRHAR